MGQSVLSDRRIPFRSGGSVAACRFERIVVVLVYGGRFSLLGICQLLSKGNQVNIPEPARGDWLHPFRGVWPSAVTQPNSEMLALVTGRVIFSL